MTTLKSYVFDPYVTVVLACSAANIERVYLDGELVVKDGEVLKHDYNAVNQEVYSRVSTITRARKNKGLIFKNISITQKLH